MRTLAQAVAVALIASASACDHPAPAATQPDPATTPEAAITPPTGPAIATTAAALAPARPIPTIPAPQTGPVKSVQLRARLAHASGIGDLAWSPTSARLVSGDDEGAVQLWDAKSGAAVRTFARQPRRISAIAFDESATRIAVAALDALMVVDAESGATLHTFVGHEDIILDLRFLGEALSAVDVRNELRRWDLRSGALAETLAVPTIHKLSAALGPGGATLALGGYGDFELLELPAARQRLHLEMPRCADAPKDLLCAAWRTVQMEEFGYTGGSPHSFKENRPNWYVQSIAYTADGAQLAIGRADGVAILLEAATGKALARFTIGVDHGAIVALSPDGATLALADREGHLALWNVAARKEIVIAGDPGGAISALEFSPDGAALAAGGPGPAVTIWELRR